MKTLRGLSIESHRRGLVKLSHPTEWGLLGLHLWGQTLCLLQIDPWRLLDNLSLETLHRGLWGAHRYRLRNREIKDLGVHNDWLLPWGQDELRLLYHSRDWVGDGLKRRFSRLHPAATGGRRSCDTSGFGWLETFRFLTWDIHWKGVSLSK